MISGAVSFFHSAPEPTVLKRLRDNDDAARLFAAADVHQVAGADPGAPQHRCRDCDLIGPEDAARVPDRLIGHVSNLLDLLESCQQTLGIGIRIRRSPFTGGFVLVAAVLVIAVFAVVSALVARRLQAIQREGPTLTPPSITPSRDGVLPPDIPVGKALFAWLFRDEFVRRSVERIQFVDRTRVRRRTSLDVVVRSESFVEDPADPDRWYCLVPLAFVAKRASDQRLELLRDFDLRNETGEAVPVLGRFDNAHVAYSLLVWVVVRSAGLGPDDLTMDEHDCLWAIVSSPTDVATAAVQRIRDAADEVIPDPDLPQLSSAWAYERAFRYLLTRLKESYLLVAELEGPPVTARHILKFSRAEPVPRDATPWSLVSRALWSRFAFVSTAVQFATSGPLPCQGLHVEIEAPPGLEVEWAFIRGAVKIEGEGDEEPRHSPDRSVASHRSLAHVYLPDIRVGELIDTVLYLRLNRGPDLLAGLAAAVVLATGLWLGVLHPAVLAGAAGSLGTILLVVPGFLTGVILLRHEHQFVARVIIGVRVVMAAAVLLSAAAAVSMIAAESGSDVGAVAVKVSGPVAASGPSATFSVVEGGSHDESVGDELRRWWLWFALAGTGLSLALLPGIVRFEHWLYPPWVQKTLPTDLRGA